MTNSASISAGSVPETLPFAARAGFGLITLRSASPLTIEILPSGAVFAFRHDGTLINQLLPGPAENGLGRLWLREHEIAPKSNPLKSGGRRITRCADLAGAGIPLTHAGGSATWTVTVPGEAEAKGDVVHCTTTLQVHPREAAWRWCIRVQNPGPTPRRFDIVNAQDLGLGDEAAVRNNEAYASHYIDVLPVVDGELGWALLARQNQPMQGGRHPWLALACSPCAEAFCTDGTQFFGRDHRLTQQATAAHAPSLATTRLQYECTLAALQSGAIDLAPGETAEVSFVARFLDDHPGASAPADIRWLRDVIAGFAAPRPPPAAGGACAASLFTGSSWLHGEAPSESDLAAWFAGAHREVERDDRQRILSFFCGESTHVATRTKEALVARPHGHILRSGDATWIDEEQFGLTAYAAGIFGAQSYLGNPSLARLLPVVRDALGVIRGSGQRMFVRAGESWVQLGVPSAFAVTPGEARWIYQCDSDLIEVRVWCSRNLAASFLDVRVVRGKPRAFVITHALALGANEFDHAGVGAVNAAEGWVSCAPAPESFTGRHLPEMCFALATAWVDNDTIIGGDELIYTDGVRRRGPYIVFRTNAVIRCGVIQLGSIKGPAQLPSLIVAARAEFISDQPAGCPPRLPLRLGGIADAAVARLNEIVPWFNHNAAIHFSAPHGLEQYGGAAWGVRDVCQGSLEWLLASGRFDLARRLLVTVFAQQYFGSDSTPASLTGAWPQWFMFPPFHTIQQAHSHGDVCFWPVKALCDYVEASGDVQFPNTPVGYTNPKTFAPTSPLETLWTHCDHVIAQLESRFVAGTALVNYGDGDWDDTLQPVDPAMRTRMISAWTVALAYHTFRQLAELCQRRHELERAARLRALLARIRADFSTQLMPDGIVAGFLVKEPDGSARPLLHPLDRVTGIRYRLLPMTRSILAELFTPEEARRHLAIIESDLRYPDGVRLMSEPAAYHGGTEKLFKRAETSANVGREIGLQYVHAHLRYAEALAKVGDAERLWLALQTVNPVGLASVVPNAAPRQSNLYFSSSDADFADRYDANARWGELRMGKVAVRGGWRLYSSGPGLYLHKVRTCLLGVRESYGDVVFDPVLPRSLDGLVGTLDIAGLPVTITYHVINTHGPTTLTVNGTRVDATRETNPYRRGGLKVSASQLATLLSASENHIEVEV